MEFKVYLFLLVSEYFQVVVNALQEKTKAKDCVNQVKLAHNQIVHIIKTDPIEIEKEFR